MCHGTGTSNRTGEELNWLENISQKPLLVLSLLFSITLLFYWDILGIGYISDDWGFVYQMEHFGWSAFQHNFTDVFFIPFSHLLGAIQYKITGGNPLLQHLIQLLTHAVVGWQIYLLCKDIGQKTSNSQIVLIGLIASILFVLNPFQVESVTWLASKSYGYTLLFSLLSLRVLMKYHHIQKGQIAFWLLVFMAIHCKEWAYVLPVIALLLLKITKTKATLPFFLGFAITISLSLFIRYIALGTFIGGYPSGQSLNLIVLGIHSIAHIVKLSSFFRFTSTEFLPVALVGVFAIVFFVLLVYYLLKNKVQSSTILYFFIIILACIFPIAGLEITSFFSTQSDRYSYFTLVPFSFIYAFIIFHLPKWLSISTFILIISLFSFYTLDYNKNWQASSDVQYTYLNELLKNTTDQERVFLYNVPDTYKDIYCMRNGLEPFLKTNGKNVDIEIYQRQNFNAISGGVLRVNDSLFIPQNAINTYTTFPKGIISQNRIPFEKGWLSEFDKSFTYFNKQLKPISK
jgi:hypothetical protein